MELTIVNPQPKYPRVGLIEPPPCTARASLCRPGAKMTPDESGGMRRRR